MAVAHQVDHIDNMAGNTAVDPYDFRNLQALCEHHHRVKTGHEGRQAVLDRIANGPRRPHA